MTPTAPPPLTQAIRDIRPDVVRRVGTALAAGTYRPPVDAVVDRLLDVLGPRRGG